MSLESNSFVLFMVINAVLCCSPKQEVALVDALTSPCFWPNVLYVIYNNIDVACGGPQLNYSMIQPPAVSFFFAEQGETYTMLMMTADAPELSLYSLKFFLNWAVTGIKAAELMYDFYPTNNIVYEYYMSRSQTYESVRYKFVLLREENGTPSLIRAESRSGFDLKQFLNSNNMCVSLVAVSEMLVSGNV